MMRKARLAIRKVNVALDSPGYCFGTGRSLKLVCFPRFDSCAPAHFDLSVLPIYVAFLKRSIVSRSLPLGSTATLAASRAMSLTPVAPFPGSRRVLCR